MLRILTQERMTEISNDIYDELKNVIELRSRE